MNHKDFLGIIPTQYTGKEVEAEDSVELNNAEEAVLFYEEAKRRLLNVNQWHQVAGMVSARFQAMDGNGSALERSVKQGDYMRVDIPGPGSKAGEGYDWVKVEEVKELQKEPMQSIGIRVRPVANPTSNENSIAHFYDESATSTFIITREGNKVTANILDRNLKPNEDNASLTDKIRDTTVGIGAIGMFSKVQWNRLASGLVEEKK